MFGLNLLISLAMAMVRIAVEIAVHIVVAILRALTGFRWRFPRFHLFPRILPRTPSAARVVVGVLAIGGIAVLASAAVWAALIVGAVVVVATLVGTVAARSPAAERPTASFKVRDHVPTLAAHPDVQPARSDAPPWFWQAALALLVAVGLGVGGYAVGRSGGPSLPRARSVGATRGRASVGRQGIATGYALGYREGRRAGEHETYGHAFHAAYVTAKRSHR